MIIITITSIIFCLVYSLRHKKTLYTGLGKQERVTGEENRTYVQADILPHHIYKILRMIIIFVLAVIVITVVVVTIMIITSMLVKIEVSTLNYLRKLF